MKKNIAMIRNIMICLWIKEEKEDIDVQDVLTKGAMKMV